MFFKTWVRIHKMALRFLYQPRKAFFDDLGQVGRKEFGHTESTDAVVTEDLKKKKNSKYEVNVKNLIIFYHSDFT